MREFTTHHWFTLFCLASIVLITLAKYAFSIRFSDFMQVVINSKYLKIYSREQKFIDTFDGLLFANLAIGISIFTYISYSALVKPIAFDLFTFLKLLFAVSSVLLIKILIERLIASVFEIDAIVDSYLFQKTTFKNFSGLVLLLGNLLLLFSVNPSKFVIYTIMILLFIINIIGFISSFKNHQKLIFSNFFYFLLYLCALEIGPYVIFYKVINEFNV